MTAARAATADAMLGGWRRLRVAALGIERIRPVWIVAALAPCQWAIAAVIARNAPHNGWLFFSGGDATEYWSHEWALAHGLLPETVLGYGVPILFAWVPRLFGPTQLTGALPIMVAQVLVLGTIALAAMYGIAARIAGRLFAAWTAALWVFAPVLVIPLWRADYHYRYEGLFLPQALGIVNLGDYPSLVVVIVGSYFVVRTIDTGRGNDAVLAGLLVGLAVGVKPANAFLLPVPVLALALARRWREIVVYGVALLPALITLALWKERGIGHLPLFAAPEVREAAGSTVAALPDVGHYLHFSRAQFHENMAQIREFFWSRLLLELLGVAGAFAVIRKSTPKGVYLVAWFTVFVVIKGGSPSSVPTTSFFRITMPGFPAYLLLVAAVPLLVPTWGRRRAAPRPAFTLPTRTGGLVVAVALLAALPLAVVAAARPAPAERLARNLNTVIETPIADSLRLRAEPAPDGVRLRWRTPDTHGSKIFYIVYRTTGSNGCAYPSAEGAQECILSMDYLGRTAIPTLVDTPLPGTYSYRVAIAAAWTGEADEGDAILLSPAVEAHVRCTTDKCRHDVAKLGIAPKP